MLPLVRKEVRAQALEEGREEGREEERQVRLQAERKLLQMIVKARFPTLTRLAKTQAGLIKDVITIEEVAERVSKAQTTEEATNALVSWLPDDNPEK